MLTCVGFAAICRADGDQAKKDLGCSVARQITNGQLNAGQLNTDQSLSLDYLRSNYFTEYQNCSGAEVSARRQTVSSGASVPYDSTVVYIPDSSTLALSSGQKITLLGIRILEEKKKEAAEYLKQKLQGSAVHIVYDRERTNRYGKLQGYVFIKNFFVNRALIDEGFAEAHIVPPNAMYETQLTRDKNAPEPAETIYEETYMKEMQERQTRIIYLAWGSIGMVLITSIVLRRWLKR